MKIAIVDTYYPEVVRHTEALMRETYAESLASILGFAFGTSNFYSRNLKPLGHECLDVIANHGPLQKQWVREKGWAHSTSPQAIALQQIQDFAPQVVFMQDLSFFDAATLGHLREKYVLAGQCSCPLPSVDRVKKFHVLFSSLPNHVQHFKSLGVRAECLPLAFEHTLLDRIPAQERDIDVSFVGGLGASLHWKSGTHAFERLAEAIGPRFHWYGYGLDRLAADSPLRQCYRGEAWGLDMYRIYGRSKIVVNRHGEIAQGYANNLRMYEATGMGALLMNDSAKGFEELMPFSVSYRTERGELKAAIDWARELGRDGSDGQGHTLSAHTYESRMPIVSQVLRECLSKAA